MKTGTPKYSLGGIDWVKIGKGALIAVAGALLAFATTTLIPALEESEVAWVAALTPVFSVLINIARKYLTDTTAPLILLLLLPALADAQIDVPPTTPDHVPIVATLRTEGVPEGAQVDARWKLSKGASFLPAGPLSIHIWAPPSGESYLIECAFVVFRSAKLDLDGDPNTPPEDVRLFISWDSYQAEFAVVGEVPPPVPPIPPNPPPPVPTPGKKFVVIVQESGAQTPELANLWLKLRNNAKVKPHNLLIVDKDNETAGLKPYVDRATDLPYVCFVDAASGTVLLEGKCPTTEAAFVEMLAKVAQ